MSNLVGHQPEPLSMDSINAEIISVGPVGPEADDLSYIVPCDRLEHVRAHLDKIIKRATKKGMTTLTYEIGTEVIYRPHTVPFHDPFHPEKDHKVVQVECREVTLSAPTLKLEGWSFVGRIEHLKADNGDTVNLVYNAPGTTVPVVYRDRPQLCEHCNTKRWRRDTFIVQHDDGRTKQVGSTCLSDFLGVDAAAFMSWATLLQSFSLRDEDVYDEQGGGNAQSRTWPLWSILRIAAATYLDRGYVSRATAEADYGNMATADLIRSYLCAKHDRDRDALIPTPAPNTQHWIDKGLALAKETEQWLQDLGDDYDALGDYLTNLAVLGKAGYCPWKAIGILGSAVMAYSREQEKKVENVKNFKSCHQGTVKGKVFVENATVILARPFEGMYGSGIIYKFRDAGGNIYLWFASTKSTDLDVGSVINFMATVKKHDIDKFLGGAAVTVVNRLNTDPAAIGRAKKKAAKVST